MRTEVNPIDWPRCGKCNLPVEDFYVLIVPEKDSILLVALCHGETEQAEIPPGVLENMRPDSLILEVAFYTKEEKQGDEIKYA